MPRVLNKKTDFIPDDAVYVGRPSKWGNPFVIGIGKDGDRATVILKYEAWILTQPELLACLHELTDKDLVCWCWPESCHAEVLLRLANPELRTIHFSM